MKTDVCILPLFRINKGFKEKVGPTNGRPGAEIDTEYAPTSMTKTGRRKETKRVVRWGGIRGPGHARHARNGPKWDP